MSLRFHAVWVYILTFVFVGTSIAYGQDPATKQDLKTCGGSSSQQKPNNITVGCVGCVLMSDGAMPSWEAVGGSLIVEPRGDKTTFVLPELDTSTKCQVIGDETRADGGWLSRNTLTYESKGTGTGWLSWNTGASNWVNATSAGRGFQITYEGRYTTTKDFEYGYVLREDSFTGDWLFYSTSTDEIHAYIGGEMYLYKWDENLADFVYIGSFGSFETN